MVFERDEILRAYMKNNISWVESKLINFTWWVRGKLLKHTRNIEVAGYNLRSLANKASRSPKALAAVIGGITVFWGAEIFLVYSYIKQVSKFFSVGTD